MNPCIVCFIYDVLDLSGTRLVFKQFCIASFCRAYKLYYYMGYFPKGNSFTMYIYIYISTYLYVYTFVGVFHECIIVCSSTA